MPSQAKCIKCGKLTHRVQKIKRNPIRFDIVSVCRNHKEDLLKDQEILKNNKVKISDYYFNQSEQSSISEQLSKVLTKVSKAASPREVYEMWTSGKEIKDVTDEELKSEYERFKGKRNASV